VGLETYAFNAEQLQEITNVITRSMAAAFQQMQPPQPDSSKISSDKPIENKDMNTRFQEKQFSRVAKLAGGEGPWKDWQFDFITAATQVNPGMKEVLEKCDPKKNVVTAEEMGAEEAIDLKELSKRSKELYGILVLITSDEAKRVVKDVTSGCGVAAWHTLVKLYARQSMAKTMRLYKEVLNPIKAKDLSDVVTAITAWENKLKEVERVVPDNAINQII